MQNSANRRENRILAMQMIYAYELVPKTTFDSLWDDFREMLAFSIEAFAFAKQLAFGVLENCYAIDQRLEKLLHKWSLERLAKVDLAILRLAIYEMTYLNETPHVVIINEAIEIGKQYSSFDSKRIINGVLDQLHHSLVQESSIKI